jgi:DnaJ-domain-containing protein 1
MQDGPLNRILESIGGNFTRIQAVILAFGILSVLYYMNNKGKESGFRKREADREDLGKFRTHGPDSGEAKVRKKSPAPPPLSLPGIRLTGEPHEVLGVRENADEGEIMRAYKDAIKRFHPDTIQGSAKDQMQFYQEASARINDAKNAMIKKIRGT